MLQNVFSRARVIYLIVVAFVAFGAGLLGTRVGQSLPTATAPARQGQGPSVGAPTINPTVAFVYGAQQTATVAVKQNACTELRNEYAQHGQVFNPTQDPQLTVIELLNLSGLDPMINSAGVELYRPIFLRQAVTCSS